MPVSDETAALALMARGLLREDGQEVDHRAKKIITWMTTTDLGRIALACYAACKVTA